MNLEYSDDGTTNSLLHSAIKEGNVRKVKALIKLGACVNKRTVIDAEKNTITTVTPIYSAIYHQKPLVLAALLCSREITFQLLDIKCRDANGMYLSPIELSWKIVEQDQVDDDNAKLVSFEF